MRKEYLQLLEAVGKFNSILNARLRFFIGTAIKDALILGNRTDLLKDDEAQALLDILETEILTDARNADEVRAFLADSNAQPQQSEKTEEGRDVMTAKEYYDAFLSPAMSIIKDEFAECFGLWFVNYVCTGNTPDESTLSNDMKLLWNAFLAVVHIRCNSELSAAISDVEA